jgi:hypothetical protein
MNREEIIRIAQEAGLHIATDVNWMPIIGFEYAERFAALVASAVREQDRENALAYMRMLHDSFSLASDPSGLKRKV